MSDAGRLQEEIRSILRDEEEAGSAPGTGSLVNIVGDNNTVVIGGRDQDLPDRTDLERRLTRLEAILQRRCNADSVERSTSQT